MDISTKARRFVKLNRLLGKDVASDITVDDDLANSDGGVYFGALTNDEDVFGVDFTLEGPINTNGSFKNQLAFKRTLWP